MYVDSEKLIAILGYDESIYSDTITWCKNNNIKFHVIMDTPYRACFMLEFSNYSDLVAFKICWSEYD